jgi:hypothetical protein
VTDSDTIIDLLRSFAVRCGPHRVCDFLDALASPLEASLFGSVPTKLRIGFLFLENSRAKAGATRYRGYATTLLFVNPETSRLSAPSQNGIKYRDRKNHRR